MVDDVVPQLLCQCDSFGKDYYCSKNAALSVNLEAFDVMVYRLCVIYVDGDIFFKCRSRGGGIIFY